MTAEIEKKYIIILFVVIDNIIVWCILIYIVHKKSILNYINTFVCTSK